MASANPAGANKYGSVVFEEFASSNITTATTTVVKSGAGLLSAVIINTNITASTITVYDNTAASGTKLATIVTSGAIPQRLEYNIPFSTGLTIVTSAATDLTVTFR